MPTKREAKYAQALDDLDAKLASGSVSKNAYDLERSRLVADAAKQPWHWGFQLLLIVGILLGALIVLRIIGAMINASNGV